LEEIEQNDLLVSPVVELEIQQLFETGRLSVRPETVFAELETSVGLRKCNLDFTKVVWKSLRMTWTRDPFDRIIAAQASLAGARLLTKNRIILANCPFAFWTSLSDASLPSALSSL
jgi:PIN domain nuclease of toxin-antitoxin system